MLYVFALTIPANTPELTPYEEEVNLTHGVITHVEVEFPPGPRGVARAYVRDGLHQVWPTNPDGVFRTDNRTIPWNEYHEMFEHPYLLTLGGWNTSTRYPHTVTFYIEVTPKELAERALAERQMLTQLMELLLLVGRRI